MFFSDIIPQPCYLPHFRDLHQLFDNIDNPNLLDTMGDLQARLKLAEGVNAAEIFPQVEGLLAAGWHLCNDGAGLEKQFFFKTYTKALVSSYRGLQWKYMPKQLTCRISYSSSESRARIRTTTPG